MLLDWNTLQMSVFMSSKCKSVFMSLKCNRLQQQEAASLHTDGNCGSAVLAGQASCSRGPTSGIVDGGWADYRRVAYMCIVEGYKSGSPAREAEPGPAEDGPALVIWRCAIVRLLHGSHRGMQGQGKAYPGHGGSLALGRYSAI